MWRATLKGLLAHKIRLGLTALAVVLGVGFVSGTYLLTDTMNRAFDDLFAETAKGVAVRVQSVPRFKGQAAGGEDAGQPQRLPAALIESVRLVPGVRTAEGSLFGYAQLVDKQGKAVVTGGAPTFGAAWITDPQLNSFTVRQGRPPERPGEVGIDAATADKHGFRVGDSIKVLLQGPPLQAKVVSILGFGEANNLGGATFVVFDPRSAQQALNSPGQYDSILVAADPGVSDEVLRDRIQEVLPRNVKAETGQDAAQADSNDIKNLLGFLNVALLVFAAIALFVGAFIIYNTFSILIAQRTRELALLRALGATAAQVRRSVLTEATIVGMFASAVGLGFGFLIALGLQGLLKAFGIDLPTTALQLLPRTIVAALVVGIGTTVVSSVTPAFRASRVPPIAALRDAEPAAYRPSRIRLLLGGLVTLVGAGLLLLGLFGGVSNAGLVVGVGAAVIFVGVTMLSPLFASPLARVLGAPLPAISGVAGKLGRENAMRNPKRTASTAGALMVGLALVSFVSIFAQSIKASASAALEETLKADYIVTASQFQNFSLDVARRLRDDGSFSAVEEFRAGVFGYRGAAQQLLGTDPSILTEVAQVGMVSGSVSALGVNDLLVYRKTAEANGWLVGDDVPVQFARTGRQNLEIVGIYADNRLLNDYVVSLETFRQNYTLQLDTVVLARTAPGVSQGAARAAVAKVAKDFPNVKLDDQAQFRETQAGAIDQLLGLVTALLGLAIIIALFGIVNTLGLSIFERTREIGLLRAVGMARRQVRTMIRWESVIIAVFGAVLGAAVGTFFGWAMVQALKDEGIDKLAIPGGQMLIYMVLAGLAGVLAAVIPAWRASRLNVLSAITTE